MTPFIKKYIGRMGRASNNVNLKYKSFHCKKNYSICKFIEFFMFTDNII